MELWVLRPFSAVDNGNGHRGVVCDSYWQINVPLPGLCAYGMVRRDCMNASLGRVPSTAFHPALAVLTGCLL